MTKRLSVLMLTLGLMLTATALHADDLSYTNWPSEEEWVDLSNALSQCFMAFKERYEATKHIEHSYFGYTFDPLKRYATTPYQGYVSLAGKIDKLAPYFVDQRKADAEGCFNSYFSSTAPTNSWPTWTAETLHEAAGFTDWATNGPLHLWMTANHCIQTQVWAALNLLQWTWCEDDRTYAVGQGEDNSIYVFAGGSNTLAGAYDDLVNEEWPDRDLDYEVLPIIEATVEQDYDYIMGKWYLHVRREYGHFKTHSFSTQVCHTVEWYYRGSSTNSGDVDVFYDFGDNVKYLEFQKYDEGTVTSTWASTVTAPEGFCETNFPECPLPSSTNENEKTWGYEIHWWDIAAIAKWDFIPIDEPVVYPNTEGVADTDRDDIVEVAGDMSSFGPDTGSMFWMPEHGAPYGVLPFAKTPSWAGTFPVHAYLSQGGTTNLPFQHLVQGVVDGDGHYQAYSLNTRIIESGWETNSTTKLKRAAVLRPRGNVVVFDFAWDSGESKFSDVGYPTGINSNRTYVLRDATPDDHVDQRFDLHFDAGVIHRFDGVISQVVDVTGMALDVTPSGFPGGNITLTNKALDARYDVALTWTEGQLTEIVYSSKDDTASITVDVDYDADDAFITAISKTGLSGSDASVSGNTITYDWGTVTRSDSGGDVTITTTLDDGGTMVEAYELNDARRVTEYELTVNGDSATTTYEYYDAATGRYNNGYPKNAKFKKITYPDGSSVEYIHAPDTGWLTQEKRPIGNGSDRIIAYSYSHAGDSSANETNLYERPRVVTNLYDSTVIGKTFYAYSGAEQIVIQECTNAAAAWNAAGNLVTTNSYCTNGLTNGLVLAVSSPLGTSTFSYEISGLSGSDFTALGKLTAFSMHSTGQTVTNILNAFGTQEKAVTLDTDSGEVTASAVSTVDAFGRLTQTTFLDGTTETYSSWTVHGPEQVTGIDGSVTTSEYYDNGQVKKVTRGDTGVVMEYEYDALDNVTSATETGTNNTSVTRRASYDAQSRPVSQTGLLGTTTYSYQNQSFGVRTTVSYPDGGELVRDCYKDGSIKKVSGSAAWAEREYEYGVLGGRFFAKEIRPASGATSEWTKKYFDLLGNVNEIENSGANGETTTLSFDAKGRFAGAEDEEDISHVLTYSDRNEVKDAGLDFNGDGSLVAAGQDRYLSRAHSVSSSGKKLRGYVYPTDNNAISNLLMEIEVALDGTQITSSYAGRTGTRARSGYSSGGSYSVTNTLSDGTKVVQEYEAWRLKTVKKYEIGSGTPWETETCTYDGLGALVKVDNSRNGEIELEYDAQRRLVKVTLPDPSKLPIEFQYWTNTDRIKSIRRADGSFVRFDYYDNGLLKRKYDLGTYDMTYKYDDQGRRTKQTTDREGTLVDTEWVHASDSGFLQQKKINAQTAETYTYRDNGQIATITDANGVVAPHAYNGAGDLTGITYSDGTTDPIRVSFNRLGQVSASGHSGVTNAFAYTLDGRLATNTVIGSGLAPDAQLTYTYGTTHTGLESASFTVDGASRSVYVGRNARKLVSSLADGNVTAQYLYESDAPFVNAVTVKVDGVSILTRSVEWDAVNDHITNITCTVDGSNVASYAYTWQTNADRIASVILADSSYWLYAYDSRGHLISGERYFANGTPYFGMQYGAEFDSIGNALKGGVLAAGEPENSFVPNNLNVHVSRIWSNRVELLGTAASNAIVTVNDEPTDRNGEWFRAVVTVDNSADAVETNITVTAVWFDAVTSNDIVASSIGTVLVAKSSESPGYDNRASMTEVSRFEYTFDAFGLLTEVIVTASSPQVREQYSYYADGRRARKVVAEGSAGSWTNTETHSFVYDAWNLIHEEITNHVEGTSLIREYVWGLDIAGQQTGKLGQEAGGIGGLLAIRQVEGSTTNVYLPICDHIGNVLHLVDADTKEVVANYLYSPFGMLVGEWGKAKDACPFRFQSKYYDRGAGLYYFGHRYYDPASTKWLSRDPLGEKGGINLTAFCHNDPVNNYDPNGRRAYGNDYTGLLDWMDWQVNEYTQEEVEKVYEVLAARDRHIYNPGLANTSAERETSRLLLERTLGVPVQVAWNPSFRQLGSELKKGGEAIGRHGWTWNPIKLTGNALGLLIEGAGSVLNVGGVALDVGIAGLEKVPLIRKAEPTYLHSMHLYNKALEHVMQQTDPNAMVYGWMHSEGAIHGANILDSLSEDDSLYVFARTFGAGGYMFREKAYVRHYGNINIKGQKDFVPQFAGMNALRNKKDITWLQVNKEYVHGLESYIQSIIIDISKDYFKENAVRVIGR